jgi:hypothetical protein
VGVLTSTGGGRDWTLPGSSLPIYQPTLAFDLPPASAFPPAIGLSAMMAVTFGVTTEAIRRGPIGRVSPIEGDIITVLVDVSPGWARISVQDRGPGVSQSDVGAPASDVGTGWGLRLVEAVSDAWGVRQGPDRFSVWADVGLSDGCASEQLNRSNPRVGYAGANPTSAHHARACAREDGFVGSWGHGFTVQALPSTPAPQVGGVAGERDRGKRLDPITIASLRCLLRRATADCILRSRSRNPRGHLAEACGHARQSHRVGDQRRQALGAPLVADQSAEVLPGTDLTHVPDTMGGDRRAVEGPLPLRRGWPGPARVQPLDVVHRLLLSRARRVVETLEAAKYIQRYTIVCEWVRTQRT